MLGLAHSRFMLGFAQQQVHAAARRGRLRRRSAARSGRPAQHRRGGLHGRDRAAQRGGRAQQRGPQRRRVEHGRQQPRRRRRGARRGAARAGGPGRGALGGSRVPALRASGRCPRSLRLARRANRLRLGRAPRCCGGRPIDPCGAGRRASRRSSSPAGLAASARRRARAAGRAARGRGQARHRGEKRRQQRRVRRQQSQDRPQPGRRACRARPAAARRAIARRDARQRRAQARRQLKRVWLDTIPGPLTALLHGRRRRALASTARPYHGWLRGGCLCTPACSLRDPTRTPAGWGLAGARGGCGGRRRTQRAVPAARAGGRRGARAEQVRGHQVQQRACAVMRR